MLAPKMEWFLLKLSRPFLNSLSVTFLVYLVEQEVVNQDFLTLAKNHSGDLKILKKKNKNLIFKNIVHFL